MWILLQRWMPQKCLATVSQHASQQPCSPVQWIHIRQISMHIGLHRAFHLLQRRYIHWSNGERDHSWSFNFSFTVCLNALCNCCSYPFYCELLSLAYISCCYNMMSWKNKQRDYPYMIFQPHWGFHNNACCRSLSTHFRRYSSCLFTICGLSLFAVTEMRCFVVRNEVLFCTALSLLKNIEWRWTINVTRCRDWHPMVERMRNRK